MMSVLTAEARAFYTSHSVFSDPGRMAGWLTRSPADVAGMRAIASRLVSHYRDDGGVGGHGAGADRAGEIDLRYAEDMLARLYELQTGDLADQREPGRRVLGCCRDFALLFVAMARTHGIPARCRVGFAGYFAQGWWIDHVVAEIWDDAVGGWRLVEPQLDDGFIDQGCGEPLGLLDVPRDRFLTGPLGWRAARAGQLAPERVVVAPELAQPYLRSWPYLMHNLVLDLAALTKHEMVLWDTWGVIETLDPPSEALAERLDAVAARIVADGAGPDQFAGVLAEPGLAVPPVITSVSPLTGRRRAVTLRT